MTTPALQSLTCPRCGGAVAVIADGSGYGHTLEQCEHVLECGHWVLRTPGTPAALAKRPWGKDAPRPRRPLGAVAQKLIAALPTSEMEAIGAWDVARRAGHAKHPTVVCLDELAKRGDRHIRRVNIAEPTRKRPSWRYWRAA